MKEIDAFEISCSKIINEDLLIKEFSEIFNIEKERIWDWDWEGDPKGNILINISYISSSIEESYPLMVTLLFNQPYSTDALIEIKAGILIAKKFDCSVFINDISSSDGFLEIFPAGKINKCSEGEDHHGNSAYIPKKIGLSLDEIADQMKSV